MHFGMRMTSQPRASVAVPVSDFTMSPLTIEVSTSETSTAAESSTNSPTGWLWESQLLGGGWSTFSTVRNPVVTAGAGNFASPGIYDIRLTASNAGGPSLTPKTRAGYLTVTSNG